MCGVLCIGGRERESEGVRECFCQGKQSLTTTYGRMIRRKTGEEEGISNSSSSSSSSSSNSSNSREKKESKK